MEIPLPSLHHPLPFPGRIWPLEILHTNNIATNLHPRWGVSGSGCHGDHLQGPGCLRLSVQPRDQEILSLQLCSCGPASRLWAPCPPPRTGSQPLRAGWAQTPPIAQQSLRAVLLGEPSHGSPHPAPSPCGPSAFLTSHGGPEERQAHPLNSATGTRRGQSPGTGQSRRALSHPQARPPGVHLREACPGPQGPTAMVRYTLSHGTCRPQEARWR